MQTWIDWAASRDGIGTPEKLALVLLASRVNAAGLGLRDDQFLLEALACKRRSLQRHLKALRDATLLEDRGDWYLLLAAPASAQQQALQAAELAPPDAPERFEGFDGQRIERALSYDVLRDEDDRGGLSAEDWQSLHDLLTAAGAEIRQGVVEAVERLLGEGRAAPEPEPEPDPILESPLYKLMLEDGIEPEKAYRIVARGTNLGEAGGPAAPALEPIDEIPPADYCAELWRTIAGPVAEIPAEIRRGWREFEAAENKHTVEGERPAIELVWPEILACARSWPKGPASAVRFFRQAFDFNGIKPWDEGVPPAPGEDARLEAEIRVMLSELERQGDPRCEVQPRTREKQADGTELVESVSAWHRRVRAKYEQMKKLKAMGVI